jgi:hypothetical protein
MIPQQRVARVQQLQQQAATAVGIAPVVALHHSSLRS